MTGGGSAVGGNAALATALAGVRVLDLSRVLAGPWAAQALADLGAEVIKVERPGAGDETRAWGPPFAGSAEAPVSAYYLSCNRGKKGVTLDLARPEGRDLLLRLAARSDVVIENFLPGVAARLGVTAAALHAVNPRLVICGISGYGQDGSLGDRPGYDFVIQGLSGLMATTGPVDGPPTKVGVAVTDLATGLYAVTAILAALRLRERSGHGYALDLALIDCAAALMANVAQAALCTGRAPARQGNAHLQIVPYELFRTADGWLVLAVGNDGQWRRFCAAATAPDLGADERYATNEARVRLRGELVPRIAAVMAGRSTGEWERLLAAADVPAGPVWNLQQLLTSDLAAERRLRVTARCPDGTPVDLMRSPLTGTAGAAPPPPPALGEHTREVLGELLGLPAARLDQLQRDGVI